MMPVKIYHGRNLRKGRVLETGRPYLITTVTRDRHPFFRDWHTGRLVVNELRKASKYAETLAWVIMPDHLHWLVIPVSEPLDTIVRRIKSCSARSINQRKGIKGPLWQKGYHERALRREEDIRAVARYIVANPLRGSLAKNIGDYPLWDAVYL
jgi:REP element-mobilizing transposase RayT